MMLSPENPLSAEPEIDTSHAEEFVEQLTLRHRHPSLAYKYRPPEC